MSWHGGAAGREGSAGLDPYAVLGVVRTASEEEIRKAYRR